MSSTSFTNGVTLTDAAWFNDVDMSAYAALTGVAGTNTITATGPVSMTAYATNQIFRFIPAATNTGATTLNITPSGSSALGAKNVFFDGRACIGGEIVSGRPCIVVYDGTQFNVVGAAYIDRLTEDTNPDTAADYVMTYDASASGFKKVLVGNLGNGTIGTPTTLTNQTSVDYTGIPAGAKKIIINFSGVSISGTANILVQLGDSGGIESSGYNGAGASIANGASGSVATSSAGFNIPVGAAAATLNGSLLICLENASSNTWCGQGIFGRGDANSISWVGASKSTSATLDRVRITTSNGTDTFDSGEVNVFYE